MTNTELDKMLEDAEAATQGEWKMEEEQAVCSAPFGCTPSGCPEHPTGRFMLQPVYSEAEGLTDIMDMDGAFINKADADHIANCSPENIKLMGERIKELETILQDIWDEADPDTMRERVRIALKLC